MNDESLIVRPDGSAAFTDFGAAQVAAPDGDMRTDRAQLLVTTALAADTDRAVAAAIDVLGDDGIVEVLPFLQPAAFERDTRIALHDQHLDLKALRESIAERTHSEVPPLEPLQRVTWQSLLKLAVIGFLAYTLISAFANIGIATIIDEFAGCRVGRGCSLPWCSRRSRRCLRPSRRWGPPCSRSASGPC